MSDEMPERPAEMEMLFHGTKGAKGDRGEQGEPGKPSTRLPAVQARAVVYLFVLNLIFVAACLAGLIHYAYTTRSALLHQQQAQQAAQRRAGDLIEQKLCADVGTMSSIRPPAGPAASNPSRAYEQAEHRAWSGLFRDLDCK
jgi:hypothetical protein